MKLGFNISERTVARYLQGLRPRTNQHDQRWKAFLPNRREAIVAFAFFAEPTLTFKLLYCFRSSSTTGGRFCCDATARPTSEWVVQQLKKAFPEADPYRYVIFDHDSKFNCDVIQLLAATVYDRSARTFRHPGKTELRNGGWEVAVGSDWTTSSHCMSGTCDDVFASMSVITMPTVFTMH